MYQHERIIRMPEASKITGLSCSTLKRLIKAGKFVDKLHITKGTVGFRLTSILKWIEERSIM